MTSLDSGVRTRSRTKSKPDQWTMVPVPVKIFLVLVDMLMIENEGGEDEFIDELDDEGRVHGWDKPLDFVDGRVSFPSSLCLSTKFPCVARLIERFTQWCLHIGSELFPVNCE